MVSTMVYETMSNICHVMSSFIRMTYIGDFIVIFFYIITLRFVFNSIRHDFDLCEAYEVPTLDGFEFYKSTISFGVHLKFLKFENGIV